MVNGRANTALRHVARVFHDGTLTGLSDRQILERFVDRHDEAAFEGLMQRHGPMVLNVCRQLLRDPHDVEDAFQAVFLVLVRKARAIQIEGSLGPWLYTVVHRVAARARANRRRLGSREISARVELAESTTDTALDRLELTGIIQEELGRRPSCPKAFRRSPDRRNGFNGSSTSSGRNWRSSRALRVDDEIGYCHCSFALAQRGIEPTRQITATVAC